MSIVVNIRAKDSTIERPLNREREKQAIVNFPQGEEKKYVRLRQTATTFVFVNLLAAWNTASAATLNPEEQTVMDDIDGVLFKVQLICAGICVSVAVLMAMIAGFFRMIGLREEAKKRYMDAIAGMTMVLTAPAVLGVVATIVRGFIKLFPHSAA